MSKQGDVASPLDSASNVIENRGFEVQTDKDDDNVICFELPTLVGKSLQCTVEFNQDLGVVSLTTLIIRSQLPYCMEFELLRLLNILNDVAPGISFTLYLDEEEGDELNVSTSHLLVPEGDVEENISRMLRYMEQTLFATLPAIYTFLMQRLVVSIDTYGNWRGCRTSVSATECFSMVKPNTYGCA